MRCIPLEIRETRAKTAMDGVAIDARQGAKGRKREKNAQIRVFIRKTIDDKASNQIARKKRGFFVAFLFDTEKTIWLNIQGSRSSRVSNRSNPE